MVQAGFTPRHRGVWLLLIVLVIAAGLASRKFGPWLLAAFGPWASDPDWGSAVRAVLGKHPGDALWALMVYLGWGWLWPRASVGRVAMAALAFSYLIEVGQLWQPPWLQAIRATTLGHLVLGSGFHAADLLAYAVGVVLGLGVDRAWQRWASGDGVS